MTIKILIPELLQEKTIRNMQRFRPILLEGHESTALFPNKTGKPLKAASIGIRIRKIAEQRLGAQVTAHLLRHLGIEQLLAEDPGNICLAQRLAGHGRPETTKKIYGHVRTSAAQRAYAELIERDLSSTFCNSCSDAQSLHESL